ncbi:heme-based aerotactic transducer [Salirhabdus euzebyi]|uniref:Heme-based aerotactic transducer n=1 Tax=Salirhabdus euzebyi TaxID=394506 RepID=A0A841PZC6_9BACI|nr:globin-coupled sensor protein [Salirhabdus euzebyi]MBB6452701.1 heme-based aerotactic transducer [Salirhabdus euzebyi]
MKIFNLTSSKKQGKGQSLLENAAQQKAILKISSESDLARQIEIIKLSEDDLKVIKVLKPIIENNIDSITEQFYGNITRQPNLLSIIEEHSSVQRLKQTLKIHIQELFNGSIDQTFIDKRLRIAHAHVRIGLQTKWYMSAFQDLFNSLSKILEENIQIPSELLQSITVVSKLLNLEQQIVLEAYEDENERIRMENQRLKYELGQKVNYTAEGLAAISEETSASIKELVGQSENIVNLSKQGTELANHSESLSQNGKKQLELQNENLTVMKNSINRIAKDSQGLSEIAKKITEVIEIVSDIAEKTNVLALNASIESARAGEHGRGFSVVATEIRKLSQQTKESTETVEELITKTNEQIVNVSDSVKNVIELVDVGMESMEKTDKYFVDILEAMTKTKLQNEKIEVDLDSLLAVVEQIDQASSEVASAADSLNQITQEF